MRSAYGAGTVAGALPMLAFNYWAFGNPLKLAYGDAVDFPGASGHDVLGLNSSGFFGITAPRFDSALSLLLAGRGLLVLTPIIDHGRRRRLHDAPGRHRAEANTILAVAAVYFLYNSGYWLPFGGGTPGPRFLIPALPFVAIGLAYAYKRLPALTLGLAIPSALMMLVGTLTYPLLGKQGVGTWADWLVQGRLEHTVLTAFGVTNAWLAIAPFVAAVLTSVVLAFRATPSTSLSDYRFAVPAVLDLGLRIRGRPDDRRRGDQRHSIAGNISVLWLIALGADALARDAERDLAPGAAGLSRAQRCPGAREPSLGPGLALEEPDLVEDEPRAVRQWCSAWSGRPSIGLRCAPACGVPSVRPRCSTTVRTPYACSSRTVAASGKVAMCLTRSSTIAGLVLALPLTMSGKPSWTPAGRRGSPWR